MTTTTMLPEDASPPPAAPAAPVSAYSTDLWDYLDTIDYMPSRQDRDALVALAQASGDDRRLQIWNYFFRIKPEDVGRPQQAEIARVKQTRDQLIAEHDGTTRALADRIEQLKQGVDASNQFYAEQEARKARKEELELRIRENGLRFRPHGLYVLAFAAVVALVLNLGLVTSFLTSPFRDGPDTPFGVVFGSWLSSAVFWLLIGGLGYYVLNSQRVGKENGELSRIKTQERDAERLRENVIRKHQQEIPGLEAQLAALDVELRERVKGFRERIGALQDSIAALQHQLPTPPDDAHVVAWLNEDLERVQRDATAALKLSRVQGMVPIATHSEETGEQRQVPNPLVFLGPAELQDPERIPPPYRPLAPRVVDPFKELSRNVSVEQLRELVPLLRAMMPGGAVNRLQPEPMPDRARHLLARRAAESAESYHILHGVYYVEYLYIGEHTLTMHGFFYDFISDRVTSERTTEQYFHDVVAIERAKEFRSIPLRYNDTEQTLTIEDAPTFTLILPSGDRRTVTFANRDYLLGIMRAMPGSAGDEAQRMAYVRAEIAEAQLNAEAAVAVMQDSLRSHKLSTGV